MEGKKREVIYTAYSSETDMTFIIKDIMVGEWFCKSTEVIGFYFGEPSDDATEEFKGKLKAEFIKKETKI